MGRYEELQAELAELEAEEARQAEEARLRERYPNREANAALLDQLHSLDSAEKTSADVAAEFRRTDRTTSDHLKVDETHAPINTAAALPLHLDATVGLRFVPPQFRERYEREMDGSFRLAFFWPSEDGLYSGSEPHREAMAAGRLRRMPEGMTPVLEREQAENNQRRSQAVLDFVNKQEADKRAARVKQERERLDREFERRKQWIESEARRRV